MRLYEKILSLKENGPLYTNCYSDMEIGEDCRIWEAQNAVLFSYADNGVNRLLYGFTEADALVRLLNSLDSQEYVLEFMTRNTDENKELLKAAGFGLLAEMMRLSSRDCNTALEAPALKQYKNDEVGTIAKQTDAAEINEVLWSVFDSRISHLLSDSEIAEVINRNEIILHRDKNGKIDALLQTVIQPQKFYINQIYNAADKRIIHAMLLNRLSEYHNNGGKYIYAWVNENNPASLRFHQKYFMEHDGMWNMVYVLNGRGYDRDNCR